MFIKVKITYLLLLGFLILRSSFLCAQKHAQKGDAFYDRSFFIEAIPHYEQELKEGKDKKVLERTEERLANCYRITGDFTNAEIHYKNLIKKNKNNAEHQLHYALSLKASAKYAEASEEFKKYIALKPNDPMGKVYLESCKLAQQWLDENLGNEVKHPDFLNTKHPEFATTFYKDGFIFCSSREDSKKPFVDFDGGHTEPKLDFYYVNLRKPYDSLKIEKFEDKFLNTALHEGPATFSPSGDTIYFTRTTNGVRDLKKNVRLKTLQIFYSVKTPTGWTKAKSAFNFNSGKYSIMHPCLSPDGRFIIFASDMPGGQGGTDLYISYNDGKSGWSSPTNLGSEINTFGNELYPFVYDEHTLYFSSDAHPGMGKLDIFKSEFKDGKWSQPQNLKPPFNSIGDDFGYAVDRKFNHGFFSSDRFDSKGLDDIYAFSDFEPIIIYADGPQIKIHDNSLFDGLKFKIQNKELKLDTDMVCKDGYFVFTPQEDINYTISVRKEGFSYNKIDFKLKRNKADDYLFWEIKANKQPFKIGGKLTEPSNNPEIKGEVPVTMNYVLIKHSGNTLTQDATDVNGEFYFKNPLEAKKTYEIISKKGGKAQIYQLSGQVFSENVPLPGTQVTLLKDGRTAGTVVTDELGYYYFNEVVPANEYILVTTKEGFLKSLTNITSEDFLNAENQNIFKNINKKKLTDELQHELAKTKIDYNSINSVPEKPFELILKFTDKNKPIDDVQIRIIENGNNLTETTSNNLGEAGFRHLDKTKNYTLAYQIKDNAEIIYELDTNEYRSLTVNTLTKWFDISNNKLVKPIAEKELKKINKLKLFATTDSIYYANHLKIIRGLISLNNTPLKNIELDVKQNSVLIDKIKTDENGNYYYDKLNAAFNHEFVIKYAALNNPKFDVFQDEIKASPTKDLVRNIDLTEGIAISDRFSSANTEDLKIHIEGYTGKDKLIVKLFENGHQRAEIATDNNNNVQFSGLSPFKSYDVEVLAGGKEIIIAPIPAQSNFFTVGDTLYANKSLKDNKLEGVKNELTMVSKAMGTVTQNGKYVQGITVKLYSNGQLVEETKTIENGKFSLAKINPRNINTLQFIDKNGDMAIEDITEADLKELIAGKKTYEFYDPELNHHNVTISQKALTKAKITYNNSPLPNQEVQLFENGLLIKTLKTDEEAKTLISYLDPTKNYLVKTKVEEKELVKGIDRKAFYSTPNPTINFSKQFVPEPKPIKDSPTMSNKKESLFPIEGKLTQNGKPISNAELRIYENGQLKDIIETDNEGDYLFTNLNPKNNNKVEVYTSSGKIDLIVSSELNNTNTPISNLKTEVTKTNLIGYDNVEDNISENLNELAKEVKPEIKESEANKKFYDPNSIIKGICLFNGLPATDVNVKIYNNGNLIAEKITNSDGNFSFEKIKDPGNYELVFNKANFNQEKQILTSNDFKTEKSKNIIQNMNLTNAIKYIGSVKNNDQSVADAVVSLTNNNRIIGKAISDKNGQFSFQLEPNKEYGAKVASKDFFNSESYITTIDKQPNSTIEGTTKMNNIEINKIIRLDNIYYDFNSANIRLESVPELEKLADFMKLNPKVKIEIRAHTDTRGDENYNLKLSLERAHNVMLFLMIEDVDKSRMVYKGFGESMPLIADAQTEEEHQYNRRTEFIVLEK